MLSVRMKERSMLLLYKRACLDIFPIDESIPPSSKTTEKYIIIIPTAERYEGLIKYFDKVRWRRVL